MKPFDWNQEKNLLLKEQRGINFDDIATAILTGGLVDNFEHLNQKNYPGQKIFIVLIANYCYVVPYVENGQTLFLKTIYPSRKASQKYLRKEPL